MVLLNYEAFLGAIDLAMACVAGSTSTKNLAWLLIHKNIEHFFKIIQIKFQQVPTFWMLVPTWKLLGFDIHKNELYLVHLIKRSFLNHFDSFW